MTDKIDGKECRYWFRPNPGDYRRCALRGKDDNCDEINDCFIKELLGKLAQKDEECNRLKEEIKTNGFGCFNIEMSEQLDQLQKTNEELQKENVGWKIKNSILEDEYKILEDNLNSRTRDFEDVIEGYKQILAEIKEIAEPYKMTIKKICGNCKKYDDCHACCYKDINCYKYTSSETNACEEFVYLDEFVPNLLANSILQKISECKVENES